MEHSRADDAIRHIDEGLEQASRITVADGLRWAVLHDRMTIKEAQQSLEAYYRAFHSDGSIDDVRTYLRDQGLLDYVAGVEPQDAA